MTAPIVHSSTREPLPPTRLGAPAWPLTAILARGRGTGQLWERAAERRPFGPTQTEERRRIQTIADRVHMAAIRRGTIGMPVARAQVTTGKWVRTGSAAGGVIRAGVRVK